MKQMNPGQGVKEGIHLQPAERDLSFTGWNYAKIPGEDFKAKLVILNDLYKAYDNLKCVVTMSDDSGNIIRTIEITVDVKQNSSETYFDFTEKVVGEIGGTFKLTANLYQNDKIVSENDYTILIVDQEKSKIEAKRLYEVHKNRTLKYGKTLYRDFPELHDLD